MSLPLSPCSLLQIIQIATCDYWFYSPCRFTTTLLDLLPRDIMTVFASDAQVTRFPWQFSSAVSSIRRRAGWSLLSRTVESLPPSRRLPMGSILTYITLTLRAVFPPLWQLHQPVFIALSNPPKHSIEMPPHAFQSTPKYSCALKKGHGRATCFTPVFCTRNNLYSVHPSRGL